MSKILEQIGSTSLCVGGVCFVVWIGLFFGINYPEIQVNTEYILASCTAKEVVVTPRFCCERTCTGCTNCPELDSCDTMLSVGNTLNPDLCDLNPQACPQTGACCNGYYCCKTCCSSCTSCEKKCLDPNDPTSCDNICSTYDCNCNCCSSASSRQCSVACPRCYRVSWSVSYADKQGIPRTARISEDFGKDRAGALFASDRYGYNTSMNCWYDPGNYDRIIFSRGYIWWKWLLIAFPTISLLLFLCYVSFTCFSEYYGDSAPPLQFILWVGIIFPILLFLPLYAVGQIEISGQVALSVLMTTFVGVGWCPLSLVGKEHSVGLYMCLYVTFFLIPISILLPLRMWVSSSSGLTYMIIILPLIGLVLALIGWRRGWDGNCLCNAWDDWRTRTSRPSTTTPAIDLHAVVPSSVMVQPFFPPKSSDPHNLSHTSSISSSSPERPQLINPRPLSLPPAYDAIMVPRGPRPSYTHHSDQNPDQNSSDPIHRFEQMTPPLLNSFLGSPHVLEEQSARPKPPVIGS